MIDTYGYNSKSEYNGWTSIKLPAIKGLAIRWVLLLWVGFGQNKIHCSP